MENSGYFSLTPKKAKKTIVYLGKVFARGRSGSKTGLGKTLYNQPFFLPG
jgi:hypothetical protein